MSSHVRYYKKQELRSNQYELTKDVSKIDLGNQSKVNNSPVVPVIIKYDVPHAVLQDVPVIQCPFDLVNTIAKVKAQLEQSPAVVGALDEFYNLDTGRDYVASYAVVITTDGVYQSRKLGDQPVSHPQVSCVEVILDVSKSIIRCCQYRHADDVNSETIKGFENDVVIKEKIEESKRLKDRVTRLTEQLSETTARETARRKQDADTIAYQKERLLNYYRSEAKLNEELETLRVLPRVVVNINDQVKQLEHHLEAARLQQVPIVPWVPEGPVTRSRAARQSLGGGGIGSGNNNNVQIPRSGSQGSFMGTSTQLPQSGSRGSLGGGSGRGGNRASIDGGSNRASFDGGSARGRGRGQGRDSTGSANFQG